MTPLGNCGSHLPNTSREILSTKIITKHGRFIAKRNSLVDYNVRWTVITKCDKFIFNEHFVKKKIQCYYKVRQTFYIVRQVSQSASVQGCLELQNMSSGCTDTLWDSNGKGFSF